MAAEGRQAAAFVPLTEVASGIVTASVGRVYLRIGRRESSKVRARRASMTQRGFRVFGLPQRAAGEERSGAAATARMPSPRKCYVQVQATEVLSRIHPKPRKMMLETT